MSKLATADILKIKDRILLLLKTQGPQTAASLAQQLDISPMAIRQHLQVLQSNQWITYQEERQPVGRPVKLWQLTNEGNKHYPDRHADLVVKLIEGVKQFYGDEGINALLADRTRSQQETYAAQLAEDWGWKQRVAALATIRSHEGYMAEVIESEKALLLVENHCPICTAAQNCPKLCQSEWELFRALLGAEVTVERVEHILQGDRRCAYLISGTN